MKLRIAILVLFATAVASALWFRLEPPESFEAQIVRFDATHGELCTVESAELDRQQAELVAICAQYGSEAYLQALRYPSVAPTLFGLYGEMTEWQAILDRHGHVVIPVVWSYVEEGSSAQQLQHDTGRTVAEVLAGKAPSFMTERLTPEQHGALAVLKIHKDGHDFLARFEVVDGEVKSRPLVTSLRVIEGLLLDGVKAVERKAVRGEEVTFRDLGWATLDVAVLTLGGHAIVKGLVAKKVAAKSAVKVGAKKTTTLKLLGTEAGKALLIVGKKAVPVAAVVGLGYLAVTNPIDSTGLAISAGAWVLEQAGVHPQLALIISSLALALMLLSLLWVVSWPLRKLTNLGWRLTKT